MNFVKRVFLSVYSRSFVHIKRREWVPVEDLYTTRVMTRFHHPLVALRYMFIENYYGENDFGMDVYKNCLKRYMTEEQINKDVSSFISLIQSFEEKGYMGTPLIIDRNCNVVNGTHRFGSLHIFEGKASAGLQRFLVQERDCLISRGITKNVS